MVLDLLLVGLGIALEPFPLIAFLLILSSEKGTRKGLAFILGWLACLVAVIAAVVLLTGGKPPAPATAPLTAVLAIKLALGVVLILYALRQWRRMGRPRKTPAWMGRLRPALGVDRGRAGRLPPAVDPRGGRRGDRQPGQALGFRELSGPPAVLPAGHLEFPVPGADRGLPAGFAEKRIKTLRDWLDTHQDQVIISISLLLGFWLAGKSLYLLVT